MDGIVQRGLIEPAADPESAAWWEELRRGSFTIPVGDVCGHAWFPPAPACPQCGRPGYHLRATTGRGRVYSWTVTHRALHAAFAEDVPYTLAAVELDEGPRVVGRFAAPAGRSPRAGEEVRTVIYEVRGQPLVGFEPAGEE